MSLTNVNRHFLPLLLTLIFSIAACNKQEKAEENHASAKAATFAAPQNAEQALVQAAKSNNRDELLTIFGPDSKDVIFSGDPEQDKASFAGFLSDYGVMHRWRKLDDGSELLLIGADNKTFPIPLRKNAASRWFFDTGAGKQEIIARRIGRDELAASDICGAIADAQTEYRAQRHEGIEQFAQRFISNDGKQDGLYWKSVDGQPKSPLGPLVALATAEGYTLEPNSHQPFHGYFFRMLDKQGSEARGGAKNYIEDGNMTGGFAVVAYPAQYGDSGIMTLIINQEGLVYEKDLGKTTEQIANAMTEFNPDKSWRTAGS